LTTKKQNGGVIMATINRRDNMRNNASNVSIGEKKLEQLKKMPMIESKVFKTPDERFIVHRTIISQVKPVEYYKAILDNQSEDY